MEVFLILNGFEIDAGIDDQEKLMLDVAAGRSSRVLLEAWLSTHCRPVND
jgi:death on curing protein